MSDWRTTKLTRSFYTRMQIEDRFRLTRLSQVLDGARNFFIWQPILGVMRADTAAKSEALIMRTSDSAIRIGWFAGWVLRKRQGAPMIQK